MIIVTPTFVRRFPEDGILVPNHAGAILIMNCVY